MSDEFEHKVGDTWINPRGHIYRIESIEPDGRRGTVLDLRYPRAKSEGAVISLIRPSNGWFRVVGSRTELQAAHELLVWLTVPDRPLRWTHSEPMVRFIMNNMSDFVRHMNATDGNVYESAERLRQEVASTTKASS